MAKSESPNTRLREDQVAALRAHRLAVAKELGVGSRGVTQDIMIAAYQSVADKDFAALVAAVRAERDARGKR